MADEVKCSACGGTEHLRPGSPWHGNKTICKPCFMVWYDGPQGVCDDMDATSAASVGAASLKLKALGRFPWNGPYALANVT